MGKRRRQSCNNPDLPMELMREILARLPVQSLLRFRGVCKSWHSLISSLDFTYLHLARYHNNDNDEDTPILTLFRGGITDRWVLRSCHTFKRIPCDVEFDCPNGYHPRGKSVNGLLLLSKSNEQQLITQMMLWNPMLGKAHQLPTLGVSRPTMGFGFDHSNNEYKVVVIARRPHASVHVFTLGTGMWRVIGGCQESIYGAHSDGVLIGGAIFWMVEYDDVQSLMVSFDLKHEVFEYIALPPGGSWRTSRYPVGYRGRIGLLDFDGENNKCCLWVMEKGKDEAVGTWGKLYTMNLQGYDALHVLCFKKNGESIVATKVRGIELWDMETQHVKHLMKSYSFYRQWTSACLLYTTLYKESLMLL